MHSLSLYHDLSRETVIRGLETMTFIEYWRICRNNSYCQICYSVSFTLKPNHREFNTLHRLPRLSCSLWVFIIWINNGNIFGILLRSFYRLVAHFFRLYCPSEEPAPRYISSPRLEDHAICAINPNARKGLDKPVSPQEENLIIFNPWWFWEHLQFGLYLALGRSNLYQLWLPKTLKRVLWQNS